MPFPTPAGSTTICKWKDGCRAVFLLMFDDNAPTMISHVIPELLRRNLPGTFYVNPGNLPFDEDRAFWENPPAGIEYANHTFSHIGAISEAQLEDEIQKCQAVFRRIFPNRKHPRLISFGRPGGVPWTVTSEEESRVLARHHLIDRPPYKGYPFTFQSNEPILALVESALEAGEMEYIAYHGVGGDWHPTPMEWFIELLDKLDSHRPEIWITDPVSWHKYKLERDAVSVTVTEADPQRIRLMLSSRLDTFLYDCPLTLETQVPEEWESCRILQNGRQQQALVSGGIVRFEVQPNNGEAILELS